MFNKPRYCTALIILIYLFFPAGAYSQTLHKLVSEIKNSAEFENAVWGIYAQYADNGEEIINSDGNKSLAPASGLKLFTSSAGLYYLGEDFRFSTGLFIRGNLNNGVLDGDIIIKGGGDPALGSSIVKGSLPLDSLMQEWVLSVKAAGIEKINGSVIADDFLFDRIPLPDYYPWIDMGNYYGAGTSALTVNNNLYYLYFKPGKPGEPAEVLRTDPVIEGLTFTNFMKTGPAGSGDNGYIYASPGQFKAVLRGTVPAGVNEFSIKGSIPDPPLFAVQYFTKSLMDNGIDVSGASYLSEYPVDISGLQKIHTTYSPPLKDIVFIINKLSNNLYTEQLLKMIGVYEFKEGSVDKGIDGVEKFLKTLNVNTKGLRLFDGSGLSRTNMITANMMCALLTSVTKQNFFEAFYNSLGVAGDPEDISAFKNFGSNTVIAYNARIKSGTINGVRSHSGYIKAKSGRLVSFSFIANNFTVSSNRINQEHIKLLRAIAEEY